MHPPFHSLLDQQKVEGLSRRQRIAQLIHVAAWSNKGDDHNAYIEALVRDYGIGGIIFFQGHPNRQAFLTNRYQEAAEIPLMISIDAEWGLAMRLDETMAFPYAMTLGAIPPSRLDLIEEMGFEIGRQCKRLGVHVNFAPVADINTEPQNPVIGFRSFGENKKQVAVQAAAYAKGLQAAGVLAVAKHFPGHGDTDTDSHLALPQLNHSRERLEEIELYPFRELFAQGIGGVMPGHIHVPVLDDTPNQGASLSPAITHELLQEEMGFQGLIFTDALNMKGASDHFKPGDLEVQALKAGNDVLLYCEDVPAAISAIEAAMDRGEISEAWLNARVQKQLAVKAWLGLPHPPVAHQDLMDDLHSDEAKALNRQLHQAAIRVINAYPHDLLCDGKVAALAFGADAPLPFHQALGEADCIYWDNEKETHWKPLLDTLGSYDQVIISVHSNTMKAGEQFGVDEQTRARVRELLNAFPSAVLVLFANAYVLPALIEDEPFPVVIAWQNSREAQEAAADIFRG